jgi:hypothetical protein
MRLRAAGSFRDDLVVFSSGAVAQQVEPNSRRVSVAIETVARWFGLVDASYVASAAAGSSTPPPV